jgi:hypothetical protein
MLTSLTLAIISTSRKSQSIMEGVTTPAAETPATGAPAEEKDAKD